MCAARPLAKRPRLEADPDRRWAFVKHGIVRSLPSAARDDGAGAWWCATRVAAASSEGNAPSVFFAEDARVVSVTLPALEPGSVDTKVGKGDVVLPITSAPVAEQPRTIHEHAHAVQSVRIAPASPSGVVDGNVLASSDRAGNVIVSTPQRPEGIRVAARPGELGWTGIAPCTSASGTHACLARSLPRDLSLLDLNVSGDACAARTIHTVHSPLALLQIPPLWTMAGGGAAYAVAEGSHLCLYDMRVGSSGGDRAEACVHRIACQGVQKIFCLGCPHAPGSLGAESAPAPIPPAAQSQEHGGVLAAGVGRGATFWDCRTWRPLHRWSGLRQAVCAMHFSHRRPGAVFVAGMSGEARLFSYGGSSKEKGRGGMKSKHEMLFSVDARWSGVAPYDAGRREAFVARTVSGSFFHYVHNV